MLGPEQERWLLRGLERRGRAGTSSPSSSSWPSSGSGRGPEPRPTGPMAGTATPPPAPAFSAHLSARQTANPIVIGGDIHSFWVTDLKPDFRDPRAPAIATEFVATSITSLGVPYQTFAALLPDNPHVRFFESRHRGYVRCAVTAERWQADLRVVADVRDRAGHRPHPRLVRGRGRAPGRRSRLMPPAMDRILFDHIAIGMRRMADAPAVLVGALGGVPDTGRPAGGVFRWGTWAFAGGGSIEIIEPARRRRLPPPVPGIPRPGRPPCHLQGAEPRRGVRTGPRPRLRHRGLRRLRSGLEGGVPPSEGGARHRRATRRGPPRRGGRAGGAPALEGSARPARPAIPRHHRGPQDARGLPARAEAQWGALLQGECRDGPGGRADRIAGRPRPCASPSTWIPPAEEGPIAIEYAADRPVTVPPGGPGCSAPCSGGSSGRGTAPDRRAPSRPCGRPRSRAVPFRIERARRRRKSPLSLLGHAADDPGGRGGHGLWTEARRTSRRARAATRPARPVSSCGVRPAEGASSGASSAELGLAVVGGLRRRRNGPPRRALGDRIPVLPRTPAGWAAPGRPRRPTVTRLTLPSRRSYHEAHSRPDRIPHPEEAHR